MSVHTFTPRVYPNPPYPFFRTGIVWYYGSALSIFYSITISNFYRQTIVEKEENQPAPKVPKSIPQEKEENQHP